ncbi:MAG TPA: hypothetical protein VKA46_10935 [Gemmataceae bacterium]|nr:hypothetical protein [Gemmataceae bacterium]
MNSALLAVVLASAVAAPAPPEEAVKPPQGPPPAQVLASMTKDGEFEITQPVLVPYVVTETRTVNVGGRLVPQSVNVTAYKTVQVTRRIKGEGVKVYTAAGKEVDAKDVPDKLKKPTIVLFAADGNKVDPFYLKIIKPDTLVVVAPLPEPTAPESNPIRREEKKK